MDCSKRGNKQKLYPIKNEENRTWDGVDIRLCLKLGIEQNLEGTDGSND